MYTPFRKTLKSLWRQFKRCTEIYPPLYYDRLIAWSADGQQNISPEAWELFEKANALDDEESWEEWDGDPEAGFYGRFHGHPAGLDEFRQLAKSAYLAFWEWIPPWLRAEATAGGWTCCTTLRLFTPRLCFVVT